MVKHPRIGMILAALVINGSATAVTGAAVTVTVTEKILCSDVGPPT